MASPGEPQKTLLNQERLKQELDISHFDPNAMLRGAQLTVVGALRALQNPGLFNPEHYKEAAMAIAADLVIRIILASPLVAARIVLWILSFVISYEAVTWDDKILTGLSFVQNQVLQMPFFLTALWRYVTPTLDNVFMDSLAWVDMTYQQKHRGEDPHNLRAMYYPSLSKYRPRDGSTGSKSKAEAITMMLVRTARKGGISLLIFALSYIPYIGRFVLPLASFYTFNNAVGLGPAGIIFGAGIFLPRRYLVVFLQSYFTSRSLMRELLEPYFARIHFTKEQKRRWFHDREGLLFGFALGFYFFLKTPIFGVLIYDIAEASTAYLITKVTDPPPFPTEAGDFAASQIQWTNKHKFLNLHVSDLDALNVTGRGQPTNEGLENIVFPKIEAKKGPASSDQEMAPQYASHRSNVDDQQSRTS